MRTICLTALLAISSAAAQEVEVDTHDDSDLSPWMIEKMAPMPEGSPRI